MAKQNLEKIDLNFVAIFYKIIDVIVTVCVLLLFFSLSHSLVNFKIKIYGKKPYTNYSTGCYFSRFCSCLRDFNLIRT